MGQVTSAHNINAEAGDHPVSADPLEQAAAAAATRLSWKEFPYYPKRYGERGWRFSLSDSGWLQTLCSLSPQEAEGQVIWLGGLLAARGMPCLLLERHLEHLHDELLRAVPERGERYAVLKSCAATLRGRRVAGLSEPAFTALSADFERSVASCPTTVGNMGRVLVAAVADEAAGVAGVVGAVQSWACDPALFDSAWLAAVERTLAAARARSQRQLT